MNHTIRIKRQENPQASPCWQEFSFEGSADTSIASVLNELNHRSPLCEKSGTVVSPIAWECVTYTIARSKSKSRFPHCVGMRLHDTQVRCLCHADQWSASSCLFRFSAGL